MAKLIKNASDIRCKQLEERYGIPCNDIIKDHIKKTFEMGAKRVWVHTCSLDHRNALNNYLARGMKIFKTEIINV